MKVSAKGIALIKFFEALKLKPYLCSAGKPTIGYGNTYYANGKKVTMQDPPITKVQAEELFSITLASFEKDVNSLLTRPVTQSKFDALVSFAWNVGSDIDSDDKAEGLGDSQLLKKVLANPDDKTIWGEFLRWNQANKKPELGLTRRRNAEAHLYFLDELNYYQNLK